VAAVWVDCRLFREYIIRNKQEMENIWRYIESNPAIWDDEDEENPKSAKP